MMGRIWLAATLYKHYKGLIILHLSNMTVSGSIDILVLCRVDNLTILSLNFPALKSSSTFRLLGLSHDFNIFTCNND